MAQTVELESTAQPQPIELAFPPPGPQSRVTAFFRLVLAIPQLVVLWVLGLVAEVVVVIAWFAALVMGRLPAFAAEYLEGYLRWSARVQAYLLLVTGAYPPFTMDPLPSYPVDLAARPGRLNRAAVLFRIILVIPAAVLSTLVSLGFGIFVVANWLLTVILGRLPVPLWGASTAVIRYNLRVSGYLVMLTSAYPGGLFGDQVAVEEDAVAPLDSDAASEPELAPRAEPQLEPQLESQPDAAVTPAWAPPSGSPTWPTPVPESPAWAPPSGPPAWPTPVPDPPAWAPPAGPPAWGPQEAEPGAGRPAAAWRLPLTQGARTLVVIAIVLGVVVLGLAFLVPVGRATNDQNQSVTAQHQVVTAYNTLVDEVNAFSKQTVQCSADAAAADLACREAADRQFAAALTAYAAQLGRADYPLGVSSEVAAAQAAGRHASSIMTSLADQGDNQNGYVTAASSPDLRQALDRVDSSFRSLNSALVNQF